MERIRVAVLFGGCSTEYEVSLQSAHAVITSLSPAKYDLLLLGITREGAWMRYSGPVDRIRDDTWIDSGNCATAVISPDRNVHGAIEFNDDKVIATRIDVAFPVLHGKNSEDGTVQGLLEMAGIPCVGCGTLSSAMCMDKDIAHRIVAAAGVKVPPSVVLSARAGDAELLRRVASLRYPLFVKPANAGSSFGITKIAEASELPNAVGAAFEHDRKVVIEESVDGFEVGCAVFGNSLITLGELDEIELSHGFFDYTEKYTLKTSRIHMPARIDADTAARVKQTAAVIYRALDCSGYARVDMFLTPEKEIVFNEVNTIPGFTAHSRYPNMLKGIGMSFGEIVDTLIGLAMDR